MAEYGEILGLAQSQNYDQQINDLFKYDQMRKQTQALNESKAKLFADDLEFQNAMNEYDAPRVKEFAANQIRRIGEFVKNNPDYATDVGKMGQLKVMKNELKNNTPLLRGLAVDKAYKEYLTDRQEALKNPNQWDIEALDAEGQKFNNYFKTGNANGLVGLQQEGEQPVVYTRPKEFVNLPETLLKSGQMINPSMVIKGKNLGEYTRTANPEHVKAVKDAIWKENGRQIQVEAKKLGLQTPEQVDKWLTDQVMAGVKTTYDPGDLNALWERGMREREFNQRQGKIDAKTSQAPNYTPFDDLIDSKKKVGLVNAEAAKKVWGDTPKITVAGNSKAEIDLTGQTMIYDGRYVTDSKGVKRLTGKVRVPVDVAYQKGIWNPEDISKLENGEGEVSSEWYGKATRSRDDKGNLFIVLDYGLPVDPKDGASRQLYNTHTQPAKLTPSLEEQDTGGGQPQQKSIPTGTKSDFIKAGWSEALIQKGIKEGKIKVN